MVVYCVYAFADSWTEIVDAACLIQFMRLLAEEKENKQDLSDDIIPSSYKRWARVLLQTHLIDDRELQALSVPLVIQRIDSYRPALQKVPYALTIATYPLNGWN